MKRLVKCLGKYNSFLFQQLINANLTYNIVWLKLTNPLLPNLLFANPAHLLKGPARIPAANIPQLSGQKMYGKLYREKFISWIKPGISSGIRKGCRLTRLRLGPLGRSLGYRIRNIPHPQIRRVNPIRYQSQTWKSPSRHFPTQTLLLSPSRR